jgi:hypothetical protein
MYRPLGAHSRPIRQTVFDILHQHIPDAQVQFSLDVALGEDVAGSVQLPPELLSMIIEAPQPPDDIDSCFSDELPAAISVYLSSWILVFDHFENSVKLLSPSRVVVFLTSYQVFQTQIYL